VYTSRGLHPRCTLYAVSSSDTENRAVGGIPEQGGSPRRAPLNRGRVLRAAVALADHTGIETLSMRNLAQDLGVAPMALYKHVANKEELLDGMVGVIVAEAQVGGNDTKELLRILKRHYPAITTVMMTQLADADIVIKMINEAQIYRVATKPIRSGVFQMAVAAAMKQHMRYRSRPDLVKRHAVAASSEPENLSLAASVVKSLSGLRQRMARLMR